MHNKILAVVFCGTTLCAVGPETVVPAGTSEQGGVEILAHGVKPDRLSLSTKVLLASSKVLQGYLGALSAEHETAVWQRDTQASVVKQLNEIISEVRPSAKQQEKDHVIPILSAFVRGGDQEEGLLDPTTSKLQSAEANVLRGLLWGASDGAVRVHYLCELLRKSPTYQELRQQRPDLVPSIPALQKFLIGLLTSLAAVQGSVVEGSGTAFDKAAFYELLNMAQPLAGGTVTALSERIVLQRILPALLYMKFPLGAHGIGASDGRQSWFNPAQRAWRRALVSSALDAHFELSSAVAEQLVKKAGTERIEKVRTASLGLIDPELVSLVTELGLASGAAALSRPGHNAGKSWATLMNEDLKRLAKLDIAGAQEMLDHADDGSSIAKSAKTIVASYAAEKCGAFALAALLHRISAPACRTVDGLWWRFGRGLHRTGLLKKETVQQLSEVTVAIRALLQAKLDSVLGELAASSFSTKYTAGRVLGDPLFAVRGVSRDTATHMFATAVVEVLCRSCGLGRHHAESSAAWQVIKLLGVSFIWYLAESPRPAGAQGFIVVPKLNNDALVKATT